MAKTKKIEAATTETTENTFSFNGKKYKVTKGSRVPLANGAATLTAADIVVSEEAQKYLVDNKCSCIEEVIE